MPHTATLPLISLALLVPVMAYAWRRQQRTANAGVVDLIWAGSIGLMAVGYATLAEGWLPRRLMVGLLGGVWSLRLTLHLYKRVTCEPEDGRYASLRQEWGDRFESKLFWFFQAQALLAVLLSLTFLALVVATEPGWRLQDVLGLLLFGVSIFGEGLADRQLSAWRDDPENRGRTCRSGLWGWSRHPNYFFEWLHWLSYPLLGIGLPFGWLLWLTPALMLFLVLKVTGIPPTEEQSIKSRGDDYRAYQDDTNSFFPARPKASTSRTAL
jgi:steroid 5-alpha reductase family enzyme